jgi:hypothetical protein
MASFSWPVSAFFALLAEICIPASVKEMWHWLVDIIAGRDFKMMGLLVAAFLLVAALVGWLVMTK